MVQSPFIKETLAHHRWFNQKSFIVFDWAVSGLYAAFSAAPEKMRSLPNSEDSASSPHDFPRKKH
jgi:hypothetical protein